MNPDIIWMWADRSQLQSYTITWCRMEAPAPKSIEDHGGASWIDRGGSQKSGRLCRFQVRYYLTDVDQDVDQRSFKASGPLKAKLGLWQAILGKGKPVDDIRVLTFALSGIATQSAQSPDTRYDVVLCWWLIRIQHARPRGTELVLVHTPWDRYACVYSTPHKLPVASPAATPATLIILTEEAQGGSR